MAYFEAESANMSTITTQKVLQGEFSEKAVNEVKNRLIDIEKKMSFYLWDSEVSEINRNSGIDKVNVSIDTLNVIRESIKYSKLSDGIFDITMGPVIKKWGIFSNNERVPSKEEVKAAMALVDYSSIDIDDNNQTVLLRKLGQMIDLGGIAKGYSTDEAIKIYKNYGIASAMINIGGNVSVLGRKENNELWNIGIQNPYESRGDIIAILECEDESVVTSGNYVRNFKVNNKEYGHILSNKRGQPVDNDVLSTTVIAKSAIEADVLSTTLFSLGIENAISFLKEKVNVDAILISKSNEVYISPSIRNKFHILDTQGFNYFYY